MSPAGQRFGRVWTTGELAQLLGATCEGPTEYPITGVASLDAATAQSLSFCEGGRWLSVLPSTQAGAVILDQGQVPAGSVALRHPTPKLAYANALPTLIPAKWPKPGVHPTAVVHHAAQVAGATIDALAVVEAGAVVGQGTWIQAHAYVGPGAVLGTRCRIGPHASVMAGCKLGNRVLLHPGAVVGADGFGFVPTPEGPVRMPQLGTVVLEDDVEVGAQSCIDRAALGETRVGQHSKLDNLVQIAHGVQVGARCLLAAFAGVAGGARLGNGVRMGGRSSVDALVRVGHRAVLSGLASATKRVPEGLHIGGTPGRPHLQWLRELAALRQLPQQIRSSQRKGKPHES